MAETCNLCTAFFINGTDHYLLIPSLKGHQAGTVASDVVAQNFEGKS